MLKTVGIVSLLSLALAACGGGAAEEPAVDADQAAAQSAVEAAAGIEAPAP
ncbi:MAG: hypothetical protein HUU25_11030, partial [Candidatus Sumerlaeia bacterium]|nr:hypothetical protein [Candidatus Sumerlaeia bacterium]